MKHVRNVAIVLALGAAMYVLRDRAGPATSVVVWLLNITFLAVLAWFLAVMYRSYRGEVMSLGDSTRAVLYGSVALISLTLTATSLLWRTGPGTIAWIALLAAACYGIYTSWRAYRRY